MSMQSKHDHESQESSHENLLRSDDLHEEDKQHHVDDYLSCKDILLTPKIISQERKSSYSELETQD